MRLCQQTERLFLPAIGSVDCPGTYRQLTVLLSTLKCHLKGDEWGFIERGILELDSITVGAVEVKTTMGITKLH